MGGLEALMDAMERSKNDHKVVEISSIEGGFSPIDGLKPGDKVKVKSELHNIYKSFDNLETIGTVYRVGDFNAVREDGSPVNADDFTMLVTSRNALVETSFDSRRFVRVE